MECEAGRRGRGKAALAGERTMSGGPYISEEEFMQWYRLLKKRRFYGDTHLRWEGGEVYIIEEQRTMRKKELQAEIVKNS